MPESAHEYGPIATGTPRRPTSSKVPGPRNHGGTEIDRISLQANQGLQKITQSSSIHFRSALKIYQTATPRCAVRSPSGCFKGSSKMVYFRRSDPLGLQFCAVQPNRDPLPGKASQVWPNDDQVQLSRSAHHGKWQAVQCSVAMPITGDLASRFRGRPAPAPDGVESLFQLTNAHPEHVRGDRAH